MDVFDKIRNRYPIGAELGRACGVNRQAISKWGRAKKIPPEHWRTIVRDVPGLTYADLYEAFYPEDASQ